MELFKLSLREYFPYQQPFHKSIYHRDIVPSSGHSEQAQQPIEDPAPPLDILCFTAFHSTSDAAWISEWREVSSYPIIRDIIPLPTYLLFDSLRRIM